MLADGAAGAATETLPTVAAERKISSSRRERPFFEKAGHIFAYFGPVYATFWTGLSQFSAILSG
jgi:hypothetical protein